MNDTTRMASLLGGSAVICSEVMLLTMRYVERVAKSNATVLITGESGVGKELIARAIHENSLRCTKPWVDVNCAALPEHLVESELFGYEAGAFSGADRTKPGLFEMAHTGTLFLDEIGELDPKTQVKLLRVLDGVAYYRLGGTKKTFADARIVAATNRNLEEAAQQGRFREDLFHRLDQVHIHVPPLRERKDDIVPLAEFFLYQQDPTMSFSADAKRALCAHPFPGNVRELRNVVIKSILRSSEDEIRACDLPEALCAPLGSPESVGGRLEEMERRMILQVLSETNNHYGKAAQLLGISSKTLSRKLKALSASTNPSMTLEA